MSRRSTPERLDEARRAGTLNRHIGEGELPERAERPGSCAPIGTTIGTRARTQSRLAVAA
jgi:hypothetical protein